MSKKKISIVVAAFTGWLFSSTFTSAQEVSVGTMRDFQSCAYKAGQDDRWQNINWIADVQRAKALAQSQRKPILMVLHNNFRGDNSSHDC